MNGFLLTSCIASIFFGFLTLIFRCNRKWISNRYAVAVLRFNLLLYVFPFSFLSNELRGYFNDIGMGSVLRDFFPYQSYIKVSRSPFKIILSDYGVFVAGIFVFWLCGALYFLYRNQMAYRNIVKLCSDDINVGPHMTPAEDIADRICSIQKDLGIKETLRIQRISGLSVPCVFGILHPVIFVPDAFEQPDVMCSTMLRHELFHIKHRDLIVQRFSLIVMLFHWYNPIIYMFIQVLNYYEELSADEYAVSALSEKERLEYGHLLLSVSMSSAPNSFLKGFGISQKQILKGRIRQLKMQKKYKMSKTRAVVITSCIIVALLCSGIPALAHMDVPVINYKIDMPDDEIALQMNADLMEFSEGISINEEFKQGDFYFTDQDGNVYYDTVQVQHLCSHTFVQGTASLHNKLDNGGCIVYTHKAERCSQCGEVNVLSLISTNYFETCIH